MKLQLPGWKVTLRQQWAWVFWAWWVIAVFPSWATLSYTKWREWRQLWGASYEEQLTIMHPPVMAEMLALRNLVSANQSVALPDTTDPNLPPLAANPMIWRALWQGQVEVVPHSAPADFVLNQVTAPMLITKLQLYKKTAPQP